MILYHEALTALLSGITTRKNEKEIWWQDERGNPITVEETGEDSWVIRWYYKNGQKECEARYYQGQLHGKDIWWYESGQVECETDFYQGQPHGKHILWYENGRVKLEEEYEQGKMVK